MHTKSINRIHLWLFATIIFLKYAVEVLQMHRKSTNRIYLWLLALIICEICKESLANAQKNNKSYLYVSPCLNYLRNIISKSYCAPNHLWNIKCKSYKMHRKSINLIYLSACLKYLWNMKWAACRRIKKINNRAVVCFVWPQSLLKYVREVLQIIMAVDS